MSSFLSSSPSGKHFHQQQRNNAKTNEQEEEVEESCVIKKEDSPVVLKTKKTKKTKHGVRVYILQRNECDTPSLLEKYERLLSKRELDSIQIESLHPETKKERLQTRAMVRTVLSSILNEGREGRKPSQRKVVDPSSLEFTFNEKGKPFLKQSTTTSSFANSNEEEKSTNSFSTSMSSENLNIQFSVSHSKNVVAMAVTTDGRRVGIDCEVEKRRTKDACLKLAKRYFRKGEAVERIETALAKEEDWGRRMFVRYWCLCESYVKALGVGISGRPFRNFDIAVTEKRNDDDEREDISLFESDPETFGRWRFQLFRETPTIKVKEDERSIVAVCVEDDDSDEDEDDDTNTNRNHTSHPSKRKRRPPIVSSITRVRPLLDDTDDSNYNNEKSSSAVVADIEDDDIEILAASS
jgi:phosphopantetheinyl transferase|tara:strand:- start:869 stop:2095 length:1227 start_codon:yes stop_codon:yes gene_type:complete